MSSMESEQTVTAATSSSATARYIRQQKAQTMYDAGAGLSSVTSSQSMTELKSPTAANGGKATSGLAHHNTISPSSVRSLPAELRNDILQFKIEGFAEKFFATHKSGLFRRRVPVNKMIKWTKVLPWVWLCAERPCVIELHSSCLRIQSVCHYSF